MEPGEDWSYCYEDDLAFVLQPGGPPEGTPPAAV
jgi:hypothetical protein